MAGHANKVKYYSRKYHNYESNNGGMSGGYVYFFYFFSGDFHGYSSFLLIFKYIL